MEFDEHEQAQLIDVCRELGSKPKFDSKDDFIAWMRDYLKTVDGEEAKPQVNDPPTAGATSGAASVVRNKEFLPRIPIFSGTPPSKSDHVPFEVWHYELQCLLKSNVYSSASILQAARLSLRGEASRVAVRLGTDATVQQLLDKMKHLYGTVDAGEDLLARFYSASQKDDESVLQWSGRLEDLLQEALQAGKIKGTDSSEILKNKFWNGLKHPLHEISGYKFDQNLTYEEFLVEVRKIEQSLSGRDSKSTQKPTKITGRSNVQQQPEGASANDNPTSDANAILLQLQTQVNALTEQMNQLSGQVYAAKTSTQSSNSQSTATQQRPPPTCWNCGKVGHVRAVCRNKLNLNYQWSLPWGMQRPAHNRQPQNN
jgi:hypothetical protein